MIKRNTASQSEDLTVRQAHMGRIPDSQKTSWEEDIEERQPTQEKDKHGG